MNTDSLFLLLLACASLCMAAIVGIGLWFAFALAERRVNRMTPIGADARVTSPVRGWLESTVDGSEPDRRAMRSSEAPRSNSIATPARDESESRIGVPV